MARRRIPEADIRAAFDMLASGANIADAARVAQVHAATLKNWLAIGTPAPAPGLPAHFPWAVLLDRLRARSA